MRAWRREAAGLACALLAHALLCTWFFRHSPADVAFSRELSHESTPTEVIVDAPNSEPGAAATPDSVTATAHAPSSAVRAASAGVARSNSAAPEQAPGRTADVPSATPQADLSGLSNEALGLATRNVFLGRLPDAPSPSPSSGESSPDDVAPGVQQSVRDALRDRDHEIGLDVGGPVVAIAEQVTRPSSAPLNSRAVFEVVADGRGDVTSVRLVDASEGWREWEKVASALAGAMRGRPLRTPQGTGMAITLEVTSRWQLPSGHDPDTQVSVFNVPVKRAPAEAKHAMHVDILKIDPKIVETPPQPGTSTSIQLPAYQLQLGTIFGTDIDPTDIAPRPMRVVHARILKEKTEQTVQ
jgi:hypothetical protein